MMDFSTGRSIIMEYGLVFFARSYNLESYNALIMDLFLTNIAFHFTRC